MGRRSDIDWEAIERDFRTTQMSLRELAAKHGVGVKAIHKKSKGDPEKGTPAWTRDLTPAVRAATKRKLVETLVEESAQQSARESLQKDNTAVEVAAHLNAQVIGGHRKTLGRVRRVVERLLDELDGISDGMDSDRRENVIAALQGAGLNTEQAKSIVGAMTLGNRLDAVKELSAALAKLIPLERTAYGIDEDGEKGSDSFEEWAREQGIIR